MKPVTVVQFCYNNGILLILDDQGRIWQKSFEWKQMELPQDKKDSGDKIKIIRKVRHEKQKL